MRQNWTRVAPFGEALTSLMKETPSKSETPTTMSEPCQIYIGHFFRNISAHWEAFEADETPPFCCSHSRQKISLVWICIHAKKLNNLLVSLKKKYWKCVWYRPFVNWSVIGWKWTTSTNKKALFISHCSFCCRDLNKEVWLFDKGLQLTIRERKKKKFLCYNANSLNKGQRPLQGTSTYEHSCLW